jgi:hypothetical protein
MTMTQDALAQALGISDRTARDYDIDVLYLLTGTKASAAWPDQRFDINPTLLEDVIQFVDGPWRGRPPMEMTAAQRLNWIVRFYLEGKRLDDADRK